MDRHSLVLGTVVVKPGNHTCVWQEGQNMESAAGADGFSLLFFHFCSASAQN